MSRVVEWRLLHSVETLDALHELSFQSLMSRQQVSVMFCINGFTPIGYQVVKQEIGSFWRLQPSRIMDDKSIIIEVSPALPPPSGRGLMQSKSTVHEVNSNFSRSQNIKLHRNNAVMHG